MILRVSIVTALVGAALTFGVQAVPAQELPATLAVSPKVAKQIQMASFDERPATLAVSPKVAKQLAGASLDSRRALQPAPLRANVTAPLSVTNSGSEVGWHQVAIGSGIGILLAAGLFLAVRMRRTWPLAH